MALNDCSSFHTPSDTPMSEVGQLDLMYTLHVHCVLCQEFTPEDKKHDIPQADLRQKFDEAAQDPNKAPRALSIASAPPMKLSTPSPKEWPKGDSLADLDEPTPEEKCLMEQAARLAAERMARKDAKLKAQAAEEQARAKALAGEQAKKVAEENAARELAAQQAKKLAEEQAKKLAEEQAKKLAEEQAKKLAEEQAKKLAEEQAKKVAEEQAKKLAEEELSRKQAEEMARKAAQLKLEKELQSIHDARQRVAVELAKQKLAEDAANQEFQRTVDDINSRMRDAEEFNAATALDAMEESSVPVEVIERKGDDNSTPMVATNALEKHPDSSDAAVPGTMATPEASETKVDENAATCGAMAIPASHEGHARPSHALVGWAWLVTLNFCDLQLKSLGARLSGPKASNGMDKYDWRTLAQFAMASCAFVDHQDLPLCEEYRKQRSPRHVATSRRAPATELFIEIEQVCLSFNYY